MNYSPKWTFWPGLLALCASLSGCGLFNSPTEVSPAKPLSPVQEFIVSCTPGSPDAMGTVSDPAFGENLRIVLEHEFLSAAGETCRRASLFSPRGEAEMVVMCRDGSGAWAMAPRVWGQGLPPVTKAVNTPAPSAPEKPKPETTGPDKANTEKADHGKTRDQDTPAPNQPAPENPAPDKGAESPATS